MDVQAAIDAPRFITLSFPSSFPPYNHFPGVLSLEDRFSESTLNDLRERGHKVEMFPAYSRRVASVEAIIYEPKTGFLRAGADSRQPAYAIVN
jgi:gamma-glutamyltranspeptidase/glutathione hydrolase